MRLSYAVRDALAMLAWRGAGLPQGEGARSHHRDETISPSASAPALPVANAARRFFTPEASAAPPSSGEEGRGEGELPLRSTDQFPFPSEDAAPTELG